MSSPTAPVDGDRGGSSGCARVLVRALALCLVALGLLLQLPARDVGKVFVLSFDGFRLSTVERLARAHELPALSQLIESGVRGRIVHRSTPESAISSVDPVDGCRSRVSVDDRESGWLWSDMARQHIPVGIVHVRGVLAGGVPGGTVLPGPDEDDGFIGDDIGRIVKAETTLARGLSWPYAGAEEDVFAWLGRSDQWVRSPWLRVSDSTGEGRDGVFRLYQLDGDRGYLTPVYRRRWMAPTLFEGAPDVLYVAEEPGWPGLPSSDDLEPAIRHFRDLVQDRASVAEALARGPFRLLVYREDVLSRLTALERAGLVGEAMSSSDEGWGAQGAGVISGYRMLDGIVRDVVAAVGESAVVVIVGRDPLPFFDGRTADLRASALGSFVIGGLGGRPIRCDATPGEISASLRYLAGVEMVARGCGKPLPAVVARIRRSVNPSGSPGGRPRPTIHSLDARSLLERVTGERDAGARR